MKKTAILLWLLLLQSLTSEAFSISFSQAVGAMTKIESSFYYQIDKKNIKVKNSNDITAEFNSWQRKIFETSPFKDSEFGYSFLLGKSTPLWWEPFILNPCLGLGQVKGQQINTLTKDYSNYQISGLVTKVSLSYRYLFMISSLEYENLIGFNDRNEAINHISWPFNFMYLSLGFIW